MKQVKTLAPRTYRKVTRQSLLKRAEAEVLASVQALERARVAARKAFSGDRATASNWILGVMQKLNAERDL